MDRRGEPERSQPARATWPTTWPCAASTRALQERWPARPVVAGTRRDPRARQPRQGAGHPAPPRRAAPGRRCRTRSPPASTSGRALLERHAQALFGAAAARAPRAHHGDAADARRRTTRPRRRPGGRAAWTWRASTARTTTRPTWAAMAATCARGRRGAGRPVRMLMDLGRPEAAHRRHRRRRPRVLSSSPQRDAFGRVTAPARLGLRALGRRAPWPAPTMPRRRRRRHGSPQPRRRRPHRVTDARQAHAG